MIDIKNYEAWFITGSQHLYGEQTLNKLHKILKQLLMNLINQTSFHLKLCSNQF